MKKQPCSIDGIRYESESADAKALGIGLITSRHRLKSSNYPRYVSEHHSKKTPENWFSKKPQEGRYSCTVGGIHYESERVAMRVLGIGIRQLRNRLQSFDFPDYVSKLHPKINAKKGCARLDCNVAGVECKSAGSASRALGITPYEMKCRLASLDYPDYISPRIPKKQGRKRINRKRWCRWCFKAVLEDSILLCEYMCDDEDRREIHVNDRRKKPF